MALMGSAPALRCSCCGTPPVGKVAHLCRVKIYSNSRAHGIGQVMVWSHKLVFLSGNGWASMGCLGNVRQLCRALRRMGSPVAALNLDLVCTNTKCSLILKSLF
jgi:hypothetical protein